MEGHGLRVIARIRSDFPEKFGIPRQSGLVKELKAAVIFEPEYRREEAVRGLEGFSHIWLIWQFSRNLREGWQPTVRPPRLGGNERRGVFATRSPFRPNPLGLSAVELEKVEYTRESGPVLHVAGADLMDGTPVYDIKPYLAYSDAYPNARGGFTEKEWVPLEVEAPPGLLSRVPEDKRQALVGVLAQDPRPAYCEDGQREFGMSFGGMEVGFTVAGRVLTVKWIKGPS